MASIARQNGRHTVRFRFDGRNYRITCETLKQARAIASTIEATIIDVRLGRLIVPDDCDVPAFFSSGGRVKPQAGTQSVTFPQAADDWIALRKTAETTLQGEKRHVGLLKVFYGRKPLRSLSTAFVQAYVNHRKPHVSSATIKKELITLRSILKYADKQGHSVPVIRWDHIELPAATAKERFQGLDKAVDGRRVLLSDSDVIDILKVVRDTGSTMIADALLLVVYSGIRRSELCRCKADDVDFDSQTITIHELKRRHGHKTTRTIPIHPDVLPMLSRRCKDHPTGPLFTGSVDTLSSGLKSALKGTRFDKPGLGWHALRHSLCSRLLARNVPITTVAAVAGHATPQTTLTIYSHAFDDGMKEAVGML